MTRLISMCILRLKLPEGVLFGSLKEMARLYPDLIKSYYGKLADTSQDGLTAFNTMLHKTVC